VTIAAQGCPGYPQGVRRVSAEPLADEGVRVSARIPIYALRTPFLSRPLDEVEKGVKGVRATEAASGDVAGPPRGLAGLNSGHHAARVAETVTASSIEPETRTPSPAAFAVRRELAPTRARP
jgi:hypothetical protein